VFPNRSRVRSRFSVSLIGAIAWFVSPSLFLGGALPIPSVSHDKNVKRSRSSARPMTDRRRDHDRD